jgi:hypothetical protein
MAFYFELLSTARNITRLCSYDMSYLGDYIRNFPEIVLQISKSH